MFVCCAEWDGKRSVFCASTLEWQALSKQSQHISQCASPLSSSRGMEICCFMQGKVMQTGCVLVPVFVQNMEILSCLVSFHSFCCQSLHMSSVSLEETAQSGHKPTAVSCV